MTNKIDLTDLHCPYSFLEAKGKLEELKVGQELEITTNIDRTFKNLNYLLKEEGHKILGVEKNEKTGAYKITVRKG